MHPSSGGASFFEATNRVCPDFSNAAFLAKVHAPVSPSQRSVERGEEEPTYLIVEATPPRLIGEGCSVKEMSFDRGGSTDASGAARRKFRPWGNYRNDETLGLSWSSIPIRPWRGDIRGRCWQRRKRGNRSWRSGCISFLRLSSELRAGDRERGSRPLMCVRSLQPFQRARPLSRQLTRKRKEKGRRRRGLGVGGFGEKRCRASTCSREAYMRDLTRGLSRPRQRAEGLVSQQQIGRRRAKYGNYAQRSFGRGP